MAQAPFAVLLRWRTLRPLRRGGYRYAGEAGGRYATGAAARVLAATRPEVSSAEGVVGADDVVDSHRESAVGSLEDFQAHIPDHAVVTLAMDVLQERN